MTTFDQRNQRVQFQYNVSEERTLEWLRDELTTLESEFQKSVPDIATAAEAKTMLANAVKEVRADQPNKASVLSNLSKAKELIKGANTTMGLVEQIQKLIGTIGGLL